MDNKKKIELIITGIGAVILIFLIINHLPGSKDDKIVSKDGFRAISGPAMVAASGTGSGNNAEWGRDPFVMDASGVNVQGIEDLALNGIAADKENPYAIINNDVVKLGDEINGMTVIEITEDNVVLERDGQKHTLELNVY